MNYANEIFFKKIAEVHGKSGGGAWPSRPPSSDGPVMPVCFRQIVTRCLPKCEMTHLHPADIKISTYFRPGKFLRYSDCCTFWPVDAASFRCTVGQTLIDWQKLRLNDWGSNTKSEKLPSISATSILKVTLLTLLHFFSNESEKILYTYHDLYNTITIYKSALIFRRILNIHLRRFWKTVSVWIFR